MENAFSKTYSDAPDKELVGLALEGSKQALEQLVRRHYAFAYNVAVRFALNPADAQDLTQESMIKVISRLSQYRQEAAFRTWLYRIVFNHFLSSRPRAMEAVVTSFEAYGETLDQIPMEDMTGPEAQAYAAEIADARIGCMTGMLLCLSREQRLVYVIGELFELDSRTGAEVLAMTPENFRQVLSRARKDLYQFMNRKCGLIREENPCRCHKKTRGFIQAGWVNPGNLQFNNDFVRRISEVARERANACDTLLEEKYGALFKDHPFYNRDTSRQLVSALMEDEELRTIFSL